jgi:hypothetical protein
MEMTYIVVSLSIIAIMSFLIFYRGTSVEDRLRDVSFSIGFDRDTSRRIGELMSAYKAGKDFTGERLTFRHIGVVDEDFEELLIKIHSITNPTESPEWMYGPSSGISMSMSIESFLMLIYLRIKGASEP